MTTRRLADGWFLEEVSAPHLQDAHGYDSQAVEVRGEPASRADNFLQNRDDGSVRVHPVVAPDSNEFASWAEQAELDLASMLRRFRELRPMAGNHFFTEDDPMDAPPETRGMCVICAGFGRDGHGKVLSPSEIQELGILRQILGRMDESWEEPELPHGWVILRDAFVEPFAQAHVVGADVIRDRAELSLEYWGVRFLAFYDYMLHDGIRVGPHTGHEIVYVEETTTEYVRDVIRVGDGELHLSETYTIDEDIPYTFHLFCTTCGSRIAPADIGVRELPGHVSGGTLGA